MRFLLLAASGAAGTIARYLFREWTHGWFGHHFPYGTLIVNVLGCFLIGVIGTLVDHKAVLGANAKYVFMIGFLGAFTTFSSFSYETWILLKDGHTLAAAANVFGSLFGCFAGLALGVWCARIV
jgi:CrcB protein